MSDATTSPEAFGPYLVYDKLGAGGMATVHRAIKTGIEGFQRPVALKRLLSQHAGDQEFVRGFVREARLASRLSHANIAQTYDLGRVDATYYIAMELVDGTDLRHVLRHSAYSVGPMPVQLVLGLLVQVCDALDYAHSFADETGRPLGIVHRDVSPANLIVGRDGVVKIIDFGIAKASSATLYTATGILKGKFSYMAPESLEGHTDSRSDLFAVGVVAYELLTAKPLFKGANDFDTLEQVKRMVPPPPSSINNTIPPEVDQVVMTALAKNPTQRWQSAGHMRNAMASLSERPNLRANTGDLPRWIEWALQQPTRQQSWDDRSPMPASDEPSMVIEVNADPATQIGMPVLPSRQPPSPAAALKTVVPGIQMMSATPAAPAAPPNEASRLRTLMVDGQQPVMGTPTPGMPPQPAAASPMSAKPTMMAWGGQAPEQQQPAQPQQMYQQQPLQQLPPQALPTQFGAAMHHQPLQHAPYGTPAGMDANQQTQHNPLANPEYMAAAAAFNAAEERRARMEAVVSMPEGVALPSPVLQPTKTSPIWIVVVLVLCVGAAVGGFFLVNALI